MTDYEGAVSTTRTGVNEMTTVKDLQAINKQYMPEQRPAPPRPGMIPSPWASVHIMPQPVNDCDEVYPNIFLGNAEIARKPEVLKDKWHVTHVLNAACGIKFNQINTSQDYYTPTDIIFHGVPAMDIATFKMAPHFHDAAEFIADALQTGGRVLVHCQQGMSRSAILVMAYLVLKCQTTPSKALHQLLKHRNVAPNPGFLQQVCDLYNNTMEKDT